MRPCVEYPIEREGMKTKAIAVEMEKWNTTAIMIFVLVATHLFLGLWRGVACAAEWKFTPASQEQTAQAAQATTGDAGTTVQGTDDDAQPLDPVVRAAVRQLETSKNCKWVEINGKTYPCHMRDGNLRNLRIDLPTVMRFPFQESPYKTKDENAYGLMHHRLSECALDLGHLSAPETPISRKPNISGADLTGARVCNFDHYYGTARGAKFVNAHISQSTFSHADLSGADFTGAEFGILMSAEVMGLSRDIGQHKFDGADLTRAKFKGATIYGVMDLAGAKLEGADFTGVKRFRPGLDNFFFGPTQNLYGMVWFDGTVCQAGSFGKCLSPSGVDKFAEEIQKGRAAASKPANTSTKKKKGKK